MRVRGKGQGKCVLCVCACVIRRLSAARSEGGHVAGRAGTGALGGRVYARLRTEPPVLDDPELGRAQVQHALEAVRPAQDLRCGRHGRRAPRRAARRAAPLPPRCRGARERAPRGGAGRGGWGGGLGRALSRACGTHPAQRVEPAPVPSSLPPPPSLHTHTEYALHARTRASRSCGVARAAPPTWRCRGSRCARARAGERAGLQRNLTSCINPLTLIMTCSATVLYTVLYCTVLCIAAYSTVRTEP